MKAKVFASSMVDTSTSAVPDKSLHSEETIVITLVVKHGSF